MAKIIGISNTEFTAKDGSLITGKNLWLSTPIDPKRGQGLQAERIFISSTKLKALDFTPTVDTEVEVLYNRFGKVQTIRQLSDEVIDM